MKPPTNGNPRRSNAGGTAEPQLESSSKANGDIVAPKPGEPFNPYQAFAQNALVPIALLRVEGLPYGAMLLYGLLRKFAGRDGRAVPAVETLASEMGTSARNVRKLIGKLEAHALVRRVRNDGLRPSDGRGSATNRYEFLWHAAFESGSTGTIVPLEEGTDEHVQPEQTGMFNRNNRSAKEVQERGKREVLQKERPSTNSNSKASRTRKPRPRVVVGGDEGDSLSRIAQSKLAQSTLEALRKIERFAGTVVRKSDGSVAAWVRELEPLADKLESATIASNLQIKIGQFGWLSNYETPVLLVRDVVGKEVEFQRQWQANKQELWDKTQAAKQAGDWQELIRLRDSAKFGGLSEWCTEALEALEKERLASEKREQRRLAKERRQAERREAQQRLEREQAERRQAQQRLEYEQTLVAALRAGDGDKAYAYADMLDKLDSKLVLRMTLEFEPGVLEEPESWIREFLPHLALEAETHEQTESR